MAMHHRLRRLERTIAPDEGGFRPCHACRNGEDKRPVFLFEGKPMDGRPADAICPACGRDRAYIFDFRRAETQLPRPPAPP